MLINSWASSTFMAHKDHGSLEDITLHPQLGDLPLELPKAGPLSPLSSPLGRPFTARSRATQLPSVPSWMPRSLATSAIGLPVSFTILRVRALIRRAV